MFLDRLLESFGAERFDVGSALGLYRHLVTGQERLYPYLKGSLPRSWALMRRWHSVQPTEHREPMPIVVVLAVSALTFVRAYSDFGVITLMMSHMILRPCEGLQAVRDDLILPSDTLSEAGVVYLRIPAPKSRWSGPRTQHASSRDLVLIALLETRYASLRPKAKLFDGAAAAYRKIWNTMMRTFNIPSSKYTPASLREGGCCFAYERNPSITHLMWRMHLSSMSMLKHYLQVAVATASLSSLAPSDRHVLLSASRSLNVSLRRVTPKTHAAGPSAVLSVAASAASDHANGSEVPPTRPWKLADFA